MEMVLQSDQMMLENEQGEGVFPRFLPLMLERPRGALRKPTTSFRSCPAFSQSEHVETDYLFGNGAPSMGTFLVCLPATLQENERVSGRPTPGGTGPRVAEDRAWATPSSPSETGLRSPPSMTRLGPGRTNGWSSEPPSTHRVHLLPSLISLPFQHPRTL